MGIKDGTLGMNDVGVGIAPENELLMAIKSQVFRQYPELRKMKQYGADVAEVLAVHVIRKCWFDVLRSRGVTGTTRQLYTKSRAKSKGLNDRLKDFAGSFYSKSKKPINGSFKQGFFKNIRISRYSSKSSGADDSNESGTQAYKWVESREVSINRKSEGRINGSERKGQLLKRTQSTPMQ